MEAFYEIIRQLSEEQLDALIRVAEAILDEQEKDYPINERR